MTIVQLTLEGTVGKAVEALGFDSTAVDLTAPEVLAALVRRAASFNCPVTPRRLAAVVREAADGLVVGGINETIFPVRATIESLTAYGDLVDLPVSAVDGSDTRTLFLAEPSFVELGSSALLTGVRADGVPLLSGRLAGEIEYDGHVRRLTSTSGWSAEELRSLGLRELSAAEWLGHPPLGAASTVLADYDLRLSAAGSAGAIEDCTVLDSTEAVTYYRGRWRALRSKDAGRFVARRPAAYGAPSWCYVEVEGGVVRRLLDLPVLSRLHRPCDEAWRLQAAIDMVRGTPQRVRIERGPRPDTLVLGILSPLPAWVQRRLDVVGRPVSPHRSIISYVLRESDVEHEIQFLEASMWTVPLTDGATP